MLDAKVNGIVHHGDLQALFALGHGVGEGAQGVAHDFYVSCAVHVRAVHACAVVKESAVAAACVCGNAKRAVLCHRIGGEYGGVGAKRAAIRAHLHGSVKIGLKADGWIIGYNA